MSSNALEFIKGYSSDEDETNIVADFVQEAKKRTLENSDSQVSVSPKKKRSVLPVPKAIQDLHKNNAFDQVPEDDPSLHDYRVRLFPHVRGNWATYVYIDFGQTFEDLQNRLVNFLCGKNIKAKTIATPHLSLSKVVTLQHHWIEDFVKSLQDNVGNNFSPFSLCPELSPKLLVNENKSRTFLTLPCSHPGLNQIVRKVDSILTEYNQDVFYDNPEFHVSLAWCLGDVRESLSDPGIRDELEKIIKEFGQVEDRVVDVTRLFCKTGHKVFFVSLK